MLKAHPYIWQDGKIRRGSEAVVSALSPGFLYGVGAFETARWRVGKRVFRLHEHAQRMARALRYLNMPAPPADPDAMKRAAETVAEANRLNEDAAVRWTCALGADGELINIVHMRPLPYDKEKLEAGLSAVSFIMERGEEAQYKTLNYAPLLLAKQAALRAGCDEAVLIDKNGSVLEASTANLFMVKDGQLATPPDDLPILSGVTRKAVLEAARECGVAAGEKMIKARELERAEEAFLTNATGGVMPLARLNGQRIGKSEAGLLPITEAVQTALARMTAREMDGA